MNMYRDGAPYGEEPTCGECAHFREVTDWSGWRHYVCGRFKPTDLVGYYEEACEAFEEWRRSDA